MSLSMPGQTFPWNYIGDGVVTAQIISDITTSWLDPTQTLLAFIKFVQNLHNSLVDFSQDDPDMKVSSKMLEIFLLNTGL